MPLYMCQIEERQEGETELTAEERLLRAIFGERDCLSVTVDCIHYFSFWNNREDCRDGIRNYVAGGCHL